MDQTAYKIKVNRTTLLNKEFKRIQNTLGQGTDYNQGFYVYREDGMDMSKCQELAQMFKDSSTPKVKESAACEQAQYDHHNQWIINIQMKDTNN